MNAIHKGEDELGLKEALSRDFQSWLVISIKYPNKFNFIFAKFMIVYMKEGLLSKEKNKKIETFILCTLGTLIPKDIDMSCF
jgi:2-aminoethylphosphonate-pyruvate transaminase